MWGPLCPAHYSVSPAILTSGNWQVGEGSQWGLLGRQRGGEKQGKRERKGGVRGEGIGGEEEGKEVCEGEGIGRG